ncbi:putative tubulin binding cofactor A [Rosa chinensis]|uniref:Tubulin-specific chaperone A n=1 Tax=Rosa chinensis TaxID=74649 RepID=A0A2P6R7I4_ROSCH|nr:putative tubulin binding cofactor A [Rosa chinensis]
MMIHYKFLRCKPKDVVWFGVSFLNENLCYALGDVATVRNLKIKTGTCKRLVKEFDSYEKEVLREAVKTTDMKGKGADLYDLKQQVWLTLLSCNRRQY